MFFGGGGQQQQQGGYNRSSQDMGMASQQINNGMMQQNQRDVYREQSSRPDRLQQIPSSIKAGPDVSDKEKFETELISMPPLSIANTND